MSDNTAADIIYGVKILSTIWNTYEANSNSFLMQAIKMIS